MNDKYFVLSFLQANTSVSCVEWIAATRNAMAVMIARVGYFLPSSQTNEFVVFLLSVILVMLMGFLLCSASAHRRNSRRWKNGSLKKKKSKVAKRPASPAYVTKGWQILTRHHWIIQLLINSGLFWLIDRLIDGFIYLLIGCIDWLISLYFLSQWIACKVSTLTNRWIDWSTCFCFACILRSSRWKDSADLLWVLQAVLPQPTGLHQSHAHARGPESSVRGRACARHGIACLCARVRQVVRITQQSRQASSCLQNRPSRCGRRTFRPWRFAFRSPQ